MFKWIKRFFGLDYNEKDNHTDRFKSDNPAANAAVPAELMGMLKPQPIDRTVEEKKDVNPMDPIGMLNAVAGKKPKAKKPAAKKPAAKRMPNKLDRGK